MSITRVAKLAGVSSSTVSRVINRHPRVAPETALSVQKAMQQLGYTPSERRPGPKPAAHLRAGTATIAFFVLGTTQSRATPGFELLLRGVSLGASHHHLHLTFSHIPDPDQWPKHMADQRFEGVLLHGAPPGPRLREQLGRFPVVWLMGNRNRPHWGDQVMPDFYSVGEMAAQYLLSRGHRRLATLNMDTDHWAHRLAAQAFSLTAQDGGAEVVTVEHSGRPSKEYWRDFRREEIDSVVGTFEALSPRPTGVFVAEDKQVAILQPALQQRGIELGAGKVQIISCNNEEPYLLGLEPRPASIDIRVESIGRRGVEHLLWRLEHQGALDRLILSIEPQLVKLP